MRSMRGASNWCRWIGAVSNGFFVALHGPPPEYRTDVSAAWLPSAV